MTDPNNPHITPSRFGTNGKDPDTRSYCPVTAIYFGSYWDTSLMIFGDCDGVVVVPKEHEDAVFAKALAKFDYEIGVREKLLSGMSTMEVYGFDKLVEKKLQK